LICRAIAAADDLHFVFRRLEIAFASVHCRADFEGCLRESGRGDQKGGGNVKGCRSGVAECRVG
jgi:hypothetical protein